MIIPIGNAAIIDTDCKLYIEFSEKISAMGKIMKTTAQNVRSFLSGSSSMPSLLYEYEEITMVIESKVVA